MLFIHTFSKIFDPGLRLGWLCGGEEMIRKCCLAKLGTDQCGSSLAQRIACVCLTRGMIEGAIRMYRRKRDCYLASMAEEMPAGVCWIRPRGGFYSWATLSEATIYSPVLLRRALKEENVAFIAGATFSPTQRRTPSKERTRSVYHSVCWMRTELLKASTGWAASFAAPVEADKSGDCLSSDAHLV